MSELFNEIDEEVRRDQLKKLWDQYSIYIVAAALLIIASVGGWRGYQYLEAKKAAEAGAAFDKATRTLRAEQAFRGGNRLCRPRCQGAVGIPHAGAVACRRRSRSRDPQAAAKLYDDIAADRTVSAPEQDLARVRAAGLLLETTTYPNMLQRLEPAHRTGGDLSPYRA